jgi:hypothetical protein
MLVRQLISSCARSDRQFRSTHCDQQRRRRLAGFSRRCCFRQPHSGSCCSGAMAVRARLAQFATPSEALHPLDPTHPGADPERPPLRLNVRPRRLPAAHQPGVMKAPPVDRLVNPLPLIMTDDTLRYGDVVMFPDGPRYSPVSPGATASATSRSSSWQAIKWLGASHGALGRMTAGSNDAWREVRVGREAGERPASG